MRTLLTLPPEILQDVLSTLDPVDVSHFSQTSLESSQFCLSNTQLYTRLFLNLFDSPPASETILSSSSSYDFEKELKERIKIRGIINSLDHIGEKERELMILNASSGDDENNKQHDQPIKIIKNYSTIFKTLISISKQSNSSSSLVSLEKNSLNIKFLQEILPNFNSNKPEYKFQNLIESARLGVGEDSILFEELKERKQFISEFNLLHSLLGQINNSDQNLLQSLQQVYTKNFYTKLNSYGPFLPLSTSSTSITSTTSLIGKTPQTLVETTILEPDYEILDSISTVMQYQLKNAIRSERWGRGPTLLSDPIILPGEEIGMKSWVTSARSSSETIQGRDWAGVEKIWVGSYALLGWELARAVNDPRFLGQIDLEDFTSALELGDLTVLKLKLDPIPTSSSSSPLAPSLDDIPYSSSTDYPTLTFSGSFGPLYTNISRLPTATVKGYVRRIGNSKNEEERSTHWYYLASYGQGGRGGMEYSLDGVEIGGMGSRRGVMGIWTDGARLHHPREFSDGGPAGPFWFWPTTSS